MLLEVGTVDLRAEREVVAQRGEVDLWVECNGLAPAFRGLPELQQRKARFPFTGGSAEGGSSTFVPCWAYVQVVVDGNTVMLADVLAAPSEHISRFAGLVGPVTDLSADVRQPHSEHFGLLQPVMRSDRQIVLVAW